MGVPPPLDTLAGRLYIPSSPQRDAEDARDTFGSFYEATDEVLGAGLSGKVRLAVSRRTGERVAVKTFSLAEMSRRQMEDLECEIQTQASVQHPNVVPLEAVFKSDERVCLLLEYLEGGQVLEHLMEEDAFEESHAIRVIGQLLWAVEHMHAQGLVHRDIKLENMMYTSASKDEVKLIDFGFCTRWEDSDRPMTRLCGTNGYMAPEVMKKDGYTNAADMWSVGVVAHVLLTGHMVGRKPDLTPVFSRRLGRCSLEAQKLVAALVRGDADARLTARQALRHSWVLGQGQRCEESCSSSCSTADSTDLDNVSSLESLRDGLKTCSSPSAREEDLSCFYLSFAEPDSLLHPSFAEPLSVGKKSIWQALLRIMPALKPGIGKQVGATLAAVCDPKCKRASSAPIKFYMRYAEAILHNRPPRSSSRCGRRRIC